MSVGNPNWVYLVKSTNVYLCASPPSLHANYAPLKRCIKISAYHELFMITIHWVICTARRMSWCFPTIRLRFTLKCKKNFSCGMWFQKVQKWITCFTCCRLSLHSAQHDLDFFVSVYIKYCNCKRNWRVFEKGKSKEQKVWKLLCCSLNCKNCGAMIRHWKSTLNSIREKVWEN